MAKNKTKYRRRLHQVSKRRNRQRAYMLDGGRCYLCRRRIKMSELTLDHGIIRLMGPSILRDWGISRLLDL